MEFIHFTKILDGAFATDGGSISILILDDKGHKHSVLLSQHLLPPSGHAYERKPGRLYFDGTIVDIRSEEESAIVSALRQAEFESSASTDKNRTKKDDQPCMIVGDDIKAYYSKIEEGPNAALQHLVSELIEYVESEDYVTYANMSGK